MANPEIASEQEQGVKEVPPQRSAPEAGETVQGLRENAGALGDLPDLPAPAEAPGLPDTPGFSDAPAFPDAPALPTAAEPRRESADRSRSPLSEDRMPLLARVLLADLAVVVVGLILLFVIEVQRLGDASLTLRRRAYAEDLVLLFGIAVVFGVVTYLLVKAGRMRVAIVQGVVALLVLGVAVASTVSGAPKPSQVTPVEGPENPVP